MLKEEFTLHSQYGFHLRPAQVMVEKMSAFTSKVQVKKTDGTEADAKSLLGLMSLGLNDGQTVEITIQGDDEEEAMKEMEKLFQSNFGE
ncbi:MAG TPA: HPr family phosphocarrier protein [Ruminococcaceae bacterium]|nr:HPr family phosphocarrier protein [Oscillospiraceae bacterium]